MRTAPAPSEPKLLLTRREVAKATGFSVRTIYEFTKRGDLPCIKFGCRGVRYPVSAIEDMIAKKLAANS